MVEFHVLGALRVIGDGKEVNIGGPRQRRLLGVLLLHRNDVVSTDRLAEAVFAGVPTPAAATTLRSYVARLRRALDDGYATEPLLATRPPGYVLRVADDALDAGRFEGLLAEGRARAGQDDATGAASALRQALDVWGGDAYAEFADEEWARPEAQRLGELRLVAHELLIDAELACGLAAELVSPLEALVAEDPLREAFRTRLMVALYRSGRQVDALRVAQRYRRLLADEVGLEPSPQLAGLEQKILEHDDDLRLTEPTGRPLRGYRLGARLGTGRDGTVHAARLPGVRRDLAIRIAPADIADRPDVVRSFEAGVRRVAALQHEAVVPIHDHWREPGAAYVVMRRMRGGTLRDRLERGPVSGPEVAALAARIGGALEAAADHGLVHGRVTPESVFFDDAGVAYLGDFALGDLQAEPTDDARAFAALVAEALTGRRPVGAEVPGAPPAVAPVLATALNGAEPPSIGELVPALVAGLDGTRGVGSGVLRPGRVNPYKGLRAFDESDAADFFGRTALVDEMLRRLDGDDLASRLVLVVGGSGSGKSSVVRAGLLPRVRAGEARGSRRWYVTTMVPGSAPFKELAEALMRVATTGADTDGAPVVDEDLAEELSGDARGLDRVLRRLVPEDGQLLLVIDQLEELFTLAGDDTQHRFLDALVSAVLASGSRLRVVATLRADFYGQPLRFQPIGSAVREATLPVPAMTAAELEAAIVGPAERIGTVVEPQLVAELIVAVVDQPAALPSLQFTLYELAESAGGGPLTLGAYEKLGGVSGAVAARAEALYTSLDDDDRSTVRRLFEQLVVISEGEPTRRRALRSELPALSPGRAVDELVDGWAAARLLSYDHHPGTREPTVEVAHEALLRAWPRLRAWIDDDRAALVAVGQLREAAAGWEALDRDPGALYRGSRLESALTHVESRAGSLPRPAQEFLEASRAARDDERRGEADRVARQARANRRLRVQLAALAITLVVALLGGALALDQRSRAQEEERVAVARELAAASVASLEEDPERSVLLALEAIDRTRDEDGSVLPEAEEALHRAVGESRIVLRVPGVGGKLDWSPDGSVFVTEGAEESGEVDVRDARTGESVLAFPGHEVDVNDVAFSADGSMLATTGDDGAARVWDAATGEELASLEGSGQVWGPSFSPDGTRLAAAWPFEDVVRVLDLTTGTTMLEVRRWAFATAFSPDGTRLAIASEVGVVVDAATGAELTVLEGHELEVTDIAWSPDGKSLATTSNDTTARIWDAASGTQQTLMASHTGRVISVDWSTEPGQLATGSEDGTARVWELTAGGAREVLTIPGGGGVVAFSPDDQRLVTGDWQVAAARIWDVSRSGGAEWARLPTPRGVPAAAAFTPDGRSLLVTADDGQVTEWDAATGAALRTLGEARPDEPPFVVGVHAIAASPDGELVASSTSHGPVRVWDARTGGERFTAGPDWWVEQVAWSPDGEVLAIAGRDPADVGVVRLVDRSGATVAELWDDPGAAPISVGFSPDGARILTAHLPTGRLSAEAGEVRIWDWAAGTVVDSLDAAAGRAAFDPTGTRIVTTGFQSNDVAIWDAATGRRLATLSGHRSPVFDAAFSPDGTTVATAGQDGTVRLWSATRGTQQVVLGHHESMSGTVTFSPDGTRLVLAGLDGTAQVWALDLDDLIDIATGRLTRSLTDDECRRYLHVDSCGRG